jgi:cytosine/adenosine deaminase-related metal-dependent hydrolase
LRQDRFTLRCRLLLDPGAPGIGTRIENAGVIVCGSRIVSSDRWVSMAHTAPRPVIDLGEVAVLPGFVNAHCHLDYTDMGGLIPPRPSFCDWIKSITTLKAGWSYTEFAESWLHGARMLIESGVTTVADIEAVPELLPEVWQATPLRVVSFLEMTGVRSRKRPGGILEDALRTIDRLGAPPDRVGLSPHAPYSTPGALLTLTSRAARTAGRLLTCHVSESIEEFEMFTHARGPMYDWIARNQRDMADCGRGTPVAHLHRHGLLGPNLLAIHANYLEPGDVDLLARTGTQVVHCPRSHDYFKHAPFPYATLRAAGVNVCLGTDSLATVRRVRGQPLRLDLFEEMRGFAMAQPAVSAGEIVRLATSHPARALGLTGRLGALTPGAVADLIAVPYAGTASLEAACAAVVDHRGPVPDVLIGGHWARGGRGAPQSA